MFDVENVKTLIYNLRLFGKTISEDFEDSEIWKGLEGYEKELVSQDGKLWSRQVSVKHKQAALIMAIDLQNMIKGTSRSEIHSNISMPSRTANRSTLACT